MFISSEDPGINWNIVTYAISGTGYSVESANLHFGASRVSPVVRPMPLVTVSINNTMSGGRHAVSSLIGTASYGQEETH
eukprot:scaffold15301_cov142-Cylindrotheca_fusiformis.AAC.1